MTPDTAFAVFNSRLREFIRISQARLPRILLGPADHQPTPDPSRPPSRRSGALGRHEHGERNCSAAGTRSLPSRQGPGLAQLLEAEFNELALALFALQFAQVEPYRRLCEARRITPDIVTSWSDIPPVPATAFKELEFSSLPLAERTTVFHSSGTTAQQPSRHFHNAESLGIYGASLLAWFKAHLLPEGQPINFVILTPSPALAPRSSLVWMLDAVRQDSGLGDSRFSGKIDETGAWTLDIDATLDALGESRDTERPVALVGTAFSFVHLLDQLAARPLHFALPAGSRVMETGGYKGRSRQLPRAELHALLRRYLGIPSSHIICEYGMSELSSQAYDSKMRNAADETSSEARVFRFPPWARVRIVSAETGREVGEGETGLIRVYDLANVRSVLAIQTEDLAVRRGDGFELLGRLELAEPRGCSLMNA